MGPLHVLKCPASDAWYDTLADCTTLNCTRKRNRTHSAGTGGTAHMPSHKCSVTLSLRTFLHSSCACFVPGPGRVAIVLLPLPFDRNDVIGVLSISQISARIRFTVDTGMPASIWSATATVSMLIACSPHVCMLRTRLAMVHHGGNAHREVRVGASQPPANWDMQRDRAHSAPMLEWSNVL